MQNHYWLDKIPAEDSLSRSEGLPPSDLDDLLSQLNGDLDLKPDTDLVEALIVSVVC